MIDDYSAIASEISELKYLLSTIPKDNVIDRMSLEHRLEVVMASLANMPEKSVISAENRRISMQYIVANSIFQSRDEAIQEAID